MLEDISQFLAKAIATVDASIDANNLLQYDEHLDSSFVIAAASARHNVDAGTTKHFIRRWKRRTNWRLLPDDRLRCD